MTRKSPKVLLLAGGYGTRLQRDVLSCSDKSYKHLLGLAKALLPIGYIPLISRWLEIFKNRFIDFNPASDFFIVSNATFWNPLKEWMVINNIPLRNLCNDGTFSNEERLGAVGDIQFALDYYPELTDNDVLIVAGDTLLYNDMDYQDFLKTFQVKHGNLILYYRCKDEETSKTGILGIDPETHRVTDFIEKPQPHDTASRNACPCFYLLKRESLALIKLFLEEMKNAPLSEKDATGKFIGWVIHKFPTFGYAIKGRFDVGDLNSYIETNDYFSSI